MIYWAWKKARYSIKKCVNKPLLVIESYTYLEPTQTVMKNLCLRFAMAVLVTGFTYTAFVSGTLDVTSTRYIKSPLSFENLLSQTKQESTNIIIQEEHVRRVNYASFRRSLMRHRSIYYANED